MITNSERLCIECPFARCVCFDGAVNNIVFADRDLRAGFGCAGNRWCLHRLVGRDQRQFRRRGLRHQPLRNVVIGRRDTYRRSAVEIDAGAAIRHPLYRDNAVRLDENALAAGVRRCIDKPVHWLCRHRRCGRWGNWQSRRRIWLVWKCFHQRLHRLRL